MGCASCTRILSHLSERQALRRNWHPRLALASRAAVRHTRRGLPGFVGPVPPPLSIRAAAIQLVRGDLDRRSIAYHGPARPNGELPHNELTRGGIVAAQLSLPKEQRGWP